MARLNTANPLVNSTPRRANESTEASTRDFGKFNDSPLPRERFSIPRNTAKHNMPTKPQSQTRRQEKGSAGSFEIFSDDPSASESETRQQKSTGKQQKQKTLGLARVNSLLLPAKRRPRPALRRETEDYDKENDVPEHATDEHRTPDVTPTRPNASQAPVRSRMENIPAGQPDIDDQREDEEEQPEFSFEEDDSSDSLDGFIVSDNDELTSYETSESETVDTEDEPSPAPSPVVSPRKRLVRGRRPNPEPAPEPETINKSEEAPSIKERNLETALDPFIKKAEAVAPQFEDDAPYLDDPSPIDEPNLHFNIHNSNDLIRHLENLELDSDNESISKSQTEGSSPESEDEMPLQLHPSRTKQSPMTPLRDKSQFSLTRSVTTDDTSPDMEVPTTIRAKKKAEAARKRDMRARLAEFNEKKIGFAEQFLHHLDNSFDNQITRMTEETGGIKIIWTKSFRNTAGRATVRTERALTGALGVECPGRRLVFSATIELSEKVLDSEDKILCTMTHEYCHLLDMLITKNGGKGAAQHGASFKQWGAKCIQALDNHPIYGGRVKVTTRHSYEINHKYVWACETQFCDFTVGRHSKSVDPRRQFCGACRGILKQIKPVPRAVATRRVVAKARNEEKGVIVDLLI